MFTLALRTASNDSCFTRRKVFDAGHATAANVMRRKGGSRGGGRPGGGGGGQHVARWNARLLGVEGSLNAHCSVGSARQIRGY